MSSFRLYVREGSGVTVNRTGKIWNSSSRFQVFDVENRLFRNFRSGKDVFPTGLDKAGWNSPTVRGSAAVGELAQTGATIGQVITKQHNQQILRVSMAANLFIDRQIKTRATKPSRLLSASTKYAFAVLPVALAVPLWCAVAVSPQTTSGTAQVQVQSGGVVTGHVRGPGGVPVPGATVELTEEQTGERQTTWTDEAGNYTLSGVHPGTYKLEVTLVGFRTDLREPVPVEAGKSLKVNVALVINVVEQPDFTGTRLASREGVPNLRSLPAELRAQLGAMAAAGDSMGGVGQGGIRFSDQGASSAVSPRDSSGGDVGSSSDVAASASNSFLLSGNVGQAPTPGDDERQIRERIQEFRNRQAGPPGFGGGGFGGFGGGGGGFGDAGMFLGGSGRRRPQVNRLRGNVMERFSNSALDARSYPLNVPESRRISTYQEQVGAAVGGPLVIPRVYNGKDKTSFFVNYNLQRNRNPFDSFGTVPTIAERSGDFSQAIIESGPLMGTVPTIYDPRSNPLGPRVPFPNHQIPASRFDSAALGLMNFISLPNLPGSVQNFHLQEALSSANDRVLTRLGHQISPKDSLNVFYFFNSSRSDSVTSFPALTTNTSVRSQNLNFGENHTFSPHVVNNFLFNFNRQRTSTLNPFAYKENIAGQLGIQGISQVPRDWGLPIISFTNFAALNDTIPALTRNQTFRAFDFLIVNKDKHNLRLGGELRRVQLNTSTNPDARGTFTFTGYATSSFTAQGSPVADTGFDFADFLLGLPQTTSVRFGTSSNYLRSWVYSGFVQDDWRFSSHLTFNLGLRYEYFQPFTEKYGHLSDLEIGPGFSSVGVVTGQSPGPFTSALLYSDKNNLAPRLGLAFRPWGQRSLVLRAGYGIFYDGSIYQRLVPNLVSQPPFAQASTLLTSPRDVLTLENGFPEIRPGVVRNTYAVDPNFRTPYGQTWSLGIEDQIARNVILSVNYTGTKGTKLDLLLAPNPEDQSARYGYAIKNALPFTYETSGAASVYHGLQVGLRRQFHSGFSVNANYTFSKSIDDAGSAGGAGRTVAQDYLDLRDERGLSVFDVRHRIIINHNYELPFGERRRYLNQGGTLARILGNWQISGVTTLQSGTPFTARVLGNLSNNSGAGPFFAGRADATGEAVSLPGFEQTTLRYFDTGAFTLPGPGQLGNAGRNTIPGPRQITFNMSLDRFLTFSREKNVSGDFRIEADNIFNTPSFSGLATVVNATNFGRVTSVGAMRTILASFRLRF